MQNQVTGTREQENSGRNEGLLRPVERNNEGRVIPGPIVSGQPLHVDTGGTMDGHGLVATRRVDRKAEAGNRLPTAVTRCSNPAISTMPRSDGRQPAVLEPRMLYAAAVGGKRGRQNAIANNQGRTAAREVVLPE